MEHDTSTTERAYKTKELATMLELAIPTIRKYALSLENAGYEFIKTENNARLFIEKDVMAIRYLKDIRKKTNITVEQASNIVVERFGKGAIQAISPSNTPINGQYEKRFSALENQIQQQTELINSLKQELKERDNKRDLLLMQQMKELQETKKLFLENKEEKKSIFSRLFKK